MTAPKPFRADDIATMSYMPSSEFIFPTQAVRLQIVMTFCCRLASEPSPDVIRDAALEEAAEHLEQVALISSFDSEIYVLKKAAGYVRSL